MSISLEKPLKWSDTTNLDTQKMLMKLQGNILKGHGRPEASLIFFTIDEGKKHEARRALRQLANNHVTNAWRQLLDAKAFKETKKDGGPFVHLALAQAGYSALGLGNLHDPETQAVFTKGMTSDVSRDALADPELKDWETGFREPIHGVILVADVNRELTDKLATTVLNILSEGGCKIVKIQKGSGIDNAAGVGIEHFGYVDGRSQPLLLVEEIDEEAASKDGIAHWDPVFPLGTALVRDPGATDDLSYGSYFIFRKLEQDVHGFKRREQEVADALELKGEERELAGAMLVGRFEDGTPVTLSDEARGASPVPNDFNYDADAAGSRCPFHAHIRKTNPRGSGGAPADGTPDTPDKIAGQIAFERSHIMVRRGQPYQDVPRAVHPNNLPEVESLADFDANVAPLLPNADVGLLFMAYNSDLANQFVFTQSLWANNTGFPFPSPPAHGIDPVIGQHPPGNIAPDQSLPKTWDETGTVSQGVQFSGFVKMKGGEYFFSPSLSFLKAL